MKRIYQDLDDAQCAKAKVQRRWYPEEEDAVLRFLLNTLKIGKAIEVNLKQECHTMKPTADLYYQEMQEQLNIPFCSVNQLKNKVRNMKKIYSDAVEWRNKYGLAVQQTDGEEAFMAITLKRCPNYVLMDEIFGNRANLSPPCIIPSSCSMQQPVPPPQDRPMFDPSVQVNIPPMYMNAETFSNEIPPQLDVIVQTPESPGSSTAATPNSRKKEPGIKGAVRLLADARNRKTELDTIRLDLENRKFEFDKLKFEREMELEKSRIENQYKISRYELELKYGVKKNPTASVN